MAVHSGRLSCMARDSGHELRAQLNGRMRRLRIKAIPGDRKTVGVRPTTPYPEATPSTHGEQADGE